jgi:tRNA threonylcarbamoyladenosine biosynthesis protein TsaB
VRVPEGPLLALDTSTSAGSVAVGDGGRVLCEITLGISGQHSTALMPAVDAAVRWAGLTPRDLRGVVVGGGPGSFTGLRIGAATAKGIVSTLGVPMWAYSGLLGAAAGCAVGGAEGAVVCALFDARRRDVYAACYAFPDADGESTVEEVWGVEALPLEQVLERVRGRGPVVFTGDGALQHAEEIRREASATVAPPHLALPRASSLLWLAARAPALGAVADPAGWEPEYVRASGAERIAADRGAAP